MHRTTIIVPPPQAGFVNMAGSAEVLSETRAVLVAQGFTKEASDTPVGEQWAWRDPAHPPGLHVTLVVMREGAIVQVSQDLMGPIGRTDKYKAIVDATVARLGGCVGRNNVRVE